MGSEKAEGYSKVPEVTLIFWVIKILATTLGETGGDSLSMSMNLGYLVSTAILGAVFLVMVWMQIAAEALQSVAVLGNDCRHHDRGHDARRFRRPLLGNRLRRGNHDTFRAAYRLTGNLVFHAGLRGDQYGELTED